MQILFERICQKVSPPTSYPIFATKNADYHSSDVLMRHIRNHHVHVESEQDTKSSDKSVFDDETITASGVLHSITDSTDSIPTMSKQPAKAPHQANVAFKHSQTPTDSAMSVSHPSALRLDFALNASDMRQSPQDQGRTNLMYPTTSRATQKQPEIPNYHFMQTETRMPPEPFNTIHPWLDGYTQDFPSVPSNSGMWDELPQLDIMGMPSGFYPSPSASRSMQPSPPKDNISDERYAKIASLWPTRKRPSRRLIQSLWRDIANFNEDNIYCEVDPGTDDVITSTEDPVRGESRWGFDNARRAKLINDCRPINKQPLDKSNTDRRVSNDTRSDSGSSGQDFQSFGTKFPSTQILDISIDLYCKSICIEPLSKIGQIQ
jgi:hypothetical protein